MAIFIKFQENDITLWAPLILELHIDKRKKKKKFVQKNFVVSMKLKTLRKFIRRQITFQRFFFNESSCICPHTRTYIHPTP